MRLISHRGNIDGKTDAENHPTYILSTIEKGYDVEIDVWSIDDKYYLGHDEPQYEIEPSFLEQAGLWCHAKNIAALHHMTSLGAHCFWHQEDDVTLTSRGYLWTYPNKELFSNSVCVLPEIQKDFFDAASSSAVGICSDFIINYRSIK